MKILSTAIKPTYFEIEPVPLEWEHARRQISSKAGCHAIIAGGAIRDHLLGFPVKDIDIFVLGMSAQAAKEVFDARIIEYGGIEEAQHRYETTSHDMPDLDLVFSRYSNVYDVLADFDLGICRVAWDGWIFVVTDDFVRDVESHTITVFDSSYADHRERVYAKFAPRGFKLVTPIRDEDYVRDLAHAKGYRLMHRRNGEYWLMRHQPLKLEEIIGILTSA